MNCLDLSELLPSWLLQNLKMLLFQRLKTFALPPQTETCKTVSDLNNCTAWNNKFFRSLTSTFSSQPVTDSSNCSATILMCLKFTVPLVNSFSNFLFLRNHSSKPQRHLWSHSELFTLYARESTGSTMELNIIIPPLSKSSTLSSSNNSSMLLSKLWPQPRSLRILRFCAYSKKDSKNQRESTQIIYNLEPYPDSSCQIWIRSTSSFRRTDLSMFSSSIKGATPNLRPKWEPQGSENNMNKTDCKLLWSKMNIW